MKFLFINEDFTRPADPIDKIKLFADESIETNPGDLIMKVYKENMIRLYIACQYFKEPSDDQEHTPAILISENKNTNENKFLLEISRFILQNGISASDCMDDTKNRYSIWLSPSVINDVLEKIPQNIHGDIEIARKSSEAQPIKFWFVNHSQKGQEQEISNGFIWAPICNSNLTENKSYSILKEISIGDVIVSRSKAGLAIGLACSRYSRTLKPEGYTERWLSQGYRVFIDWLPVNKNYMVADNNYLMQDPLEVINKTTGISEKILSQTREKIINAFAIYSDNTSEKINIRANQKIFASEIKKDTFAELLMIALQQEDRLSHNSSTIIDSINDIFERSWRLKKIEECKLEEFKTDDLLLAIIHSEEFSAVLKEIFNNLVYSTYSNEDATNTEHIVKSILSDKNDRSKIEKNNYFKDICKKVNSSDVYKILNTIREKAHAEKIALRELVRCVNKNIKFITYSSEGEMNLAQSSPIRIVLDI